MKYSGNSSRRLFLRHAALAGVVPVIAPRLYAAEGANSRINLGFVGMGTQNRGLMGGFLGQEGVQVVAVCDVDTNRRENAQKAALEYYRSKGREEKVDAYVDFRELVARKDIDAVVIATPDHWHAIITVAALNAGKDVYCEKPLVHSVEEAVAVIDAVKRNGRVLQTGSMQRSMKEFRAACEIVRNGFIGDVRGVTASFGPPGRPCDLPEEEMEPGLDWDRWLGPAALRPYHSALSPRGVHRHFPDWRNYREFGGGMVTDWGAHHIDIAHWALGMDGRGPVEVIPPANSASATEGVKLVYPGGVAVTHSNGGFGVEIEGSKGQVKVNRGRIVVEVEGRVLASFTGKEGDTSLDREVAKLDRTVLADPAVRLYRTENGNHLTDFLKAVRSRTKPCTHEEIGARTATACNLANLAYYHGKTIRWDPEGFRFAPGSEGNPEWLRDPVRGDWKLS